MNAQYVAYFLPRPSLGPSIFSHALKVRQSCDAIRTTAEQTTKLVPHIMDESEVKF